MRHDQSMRFGLIIAVVASCTSATTSLAADTSKPARLEQIPGLDAKRIILTPKAAQRLAIKTGRVREKPVPGWLTVWGVVEAVAASPAVVATTASIPRSTDAPTVTDSGAVRVRVPATVTSGAVPSPSLRIAGDDDDDDDDDEDGNDGDARNRTKDGGSRKKSKRGVTPSPMIAVPLRSGSGVVRWRTIPIDAAPSAVSGIDPSDAAIAHDYLVDRKDHGLVPGQRVYVRIPQPASGMLQRVIPYAAVLYDAAGRSWVYTNPEPLVFVRHGVSIDFVQDTLAYLKEGPATGTAIVTAGAAELAGVEQKFGH